MKTIEVSDEMYEQLVALGTEMTTQNMRATAMPHMFQIQTQHKVFDHNLNGNNKCFIYADGDYLVIESPDELINFLKSNNVEYPSDIKEMWEESFYTSEDEKFDGYDLRDFIKENCEYLEESSYSWGQKYENSFFTAKGCKEHIESNRHHYKQPVDYLSHAFRNPEMELVSKFLCELVGKKIHK